MKPYTETVGPTEIVVEAENPHGIATELVAHRFTDKDGFRLLHRHRGQFWLWNGSYYRELNDEAVRAELWNFLPLTKVYFTNSKGSFPAPFKPKREHINGTIDALSALCRLNDDWEPPFWLRPSRLPPQELFACGNGLLHLPTGKLHPSTPAYFALSASTVSYRRSAPKPKRWLKFLDQVLGDKQSISALHEIFGYVLSPDTSQQKLFLLEGPPRSGKGTTARILTELVGSQSVAGPSVSGLARDFGLQSLITKPLAIIPDARIGKNTDKARLAEILLSISGEDRLTIDRKNIEAWHGTLRTRIVIMTNGLLAIADDSTALANRFITVHYPNSYLGRENPNLTNQLLEELAGILNLAIDGYRRLRKRRHFVQPQVSAEMIEEMIVLGSPVGAFVRDCCVVEAGASILKDEIFAVYKIWAKLEGQRETNAKWVGRGLRQVVPGIGKGRPKVKGKEKDKRELHYYGVALNEYGRELLKPSTRTM